MEKAPDRAEPMITRVTVSYRLPGDSTEHQFTIEHEGEGAPMDAVSWSPPLMKQMVYREGTGYREPERKPAGSEWKVTRSEDSTTRSTSMSGYPQCVWYHDASCRWWEWCEDM